MKKSSIISVLYHGTCPANAEALLKNGWQPNKVPQGGNMGQPKYLYLTTGYEDALWFAEEKGCDTVIELHDVPADFLMVDPEDGIGATVEEEISNEHGLPGKVILTKPLPAHHFRMSHHKTGSAKVRCILDIMDAHRGELFGKVTALIGDEEVGYVKFSEYPDLYAPGLEEGDEVPRAININYVEVKPEYRRQGIGTKMYQKIQEDFPGERITSTGTTDEGGAFRSKLLERGVLAAAERLRQVKENGVRKYKCPCGNVDLDDNGRMIVGSFVECDVDGNEIPDGEISSYIRCGKCGRVFELLGQMRTVRQGIQHALFASELPAGVKEYAQRVAAANPAINGIFLIGSSTQGQGNDIDLLYDFGHVGIETEEDLEHLIESQEGLDLDSYDTFVRVDDKYYHLSMGAGRGWVENTDYAKAQRGKPMVKLAWQEIEYIEKDKQEEVQGTLLGGILESDHDLIAWADKEDLPPKRTAQRLKFMKLFSGKKVAVIDDMRAFTRGKGYGTKMIQKFIAEAKAKGCDAVILQAGIFEKQVKGFDLVDWYKRLGFQTAGKSAELPLMVKWLKGPKTASLAPSETWERIKRDFYAGIVYHGTTVGIAEEIMKNGFRGLNYDQILLDVLALYGKKWEDISPTYQKIITENKNSYAHEFDTVSTTPAGEVALRFAGQGGEVPHAVERFVLESERDLKQSESRISGEPAVVMCQIKDFKNTPFYQRVDQWMKGLENLARDGGITGDFDLDEAAEDAWTHYTNFNCTPDQLEPIRVLTGGTLTLLKQGPLPEGKLAGKYAKMAKEDIKPMKNASTQINLPEELAHKIQAIARKVIDPADLMGDGFENESHITIKYGVNEDEDGLIEAVSDLAPFEVKLGKTHTFEPSKSSDGAAPVVINIDAPELTKLHETVAAAIGNRPDDFEYHAHATLAYVKPEAASKYDGLDFLEGVTFEATNITLSKKDRIQITIPFGKINKTASVGTSSMTMNADEDGFPAMVIIRWPQRGMRWRTVLKVVKQIAGEIAGKRVPWRGIHIFESPWGSFDEQQDTFPRWAQAQKFVMYDILPDGSFISVGKQPPTTKTGGLSSGPKGKYCECGQDQSNFWYCDREGTPQEDQQAKSKYVICGECKRIYNFSNGQRIGIRPPSRQKKLQFTGAEKIRTENGDFICICGNTPNGEGFYPCDSDGHQVEPIGVDQGGEWDGKLWVCDRCNRIINGKTLRVVGQTQQHMFKKDEFESFDIQGSHKVTPLSDTQFENPEIGMETNAYADMPERVKGDEAMPSLEELAPEMFKQAALLYDFNDLVNNAIAYHGLPPSKTNWNGWFEFQKSYLTEQTGVTDDDQLNEALWDMATYVLVDTDMLSRFDPDYEKQYAVGQAAKVAQYLKTVFWQRIDRAIWLLNKNKPEMVKEKPTWQKETDQSFETRESQENVDNFIHQFIEWMKKEMAKQPQLLKNRQPTRPTRFDLFETLLQLIADHGTDKPVMLEKPWKQQTGLGVDSLRSYLLRLHRYLDQYTKLVGGNPLVAKMSSMKTAATLPTLDQALRWNFVNFPDDHEPHLGENVDWNEIEPLAKADAEAAGKNWDELNYDQQYEFAYHHIMEQMKARYADVTRLFTGKFPLTIYRAITLEEGLKPETLNTQEFGVNWSWAESGAHPYCGNINQPTYVFRAQVNKDQINWSDTAGCNVVNDLEKEVRLYPGEQVKITGWKACGETKWRRPLGHFRTVVSHYAEMPSTMQHFTNKPKAPYGMWKTLKSDPFAEEFELFGDKKEEQQPEEKKTEFKPNQNLKHIMAKTKLVHRGAGKSKQSKQAGAAKPIHEDIEGAPFKIGMTVRYVNPQDEEEADDLGTVGYLGQTGTVEYYEYSCGCGQTYPNDPMIGVRFPDGELHEFWADELEPADS